MTIVDRVVFKMPLNQEYQFPAMSVLQGWVGCFKQKMENNDASFGKAKWELEYAVDMPPEDWQFFQDAGLELAGVGVKVPHIEHPDMVIDMTDARIDAYSALDVHVFQTCVRMSGLAVNCRPFPVLPQKRPQAVSPVWVGSKYLLGVKNVATASLSLATPDLVGYLLGQKEPITGIVDVAGRATSLAAATGIGVIEIVPPGRPRNWLSKFSNQLYRPVSGEDIAHQITRAQKSIERRIQCSEAQVDQSTVQT